MSRLTRQQRADRAVVREIRSLLERTGGKSLVGLQEQLRTYKTKAHLEDIVARMVQSDELIPTINLADVEIYNLPRAA